MSNKRIMIINSGWEQTDLIRKAKDQGLYVIATDLQPDAPGFQLADETAVADPRDLSQLFAIASEKKIDAIISDQCDYSHFAAAYIAERLGLPGASLGAAQHSTNKKWMRLACSHTSIQQPRFIACKTIQEAKLAVHEIGLPVIIKPLDNRGNFGVNQVEHISQLEEAFFEAIANSHSRECLVEQFIQGTMATVDGFVFGIHGHYSLAVASKAMLGGRKRVAMEIVYPAEFPQKIVKELQLCHNKVVQALGIQYGCTHGEYMVTETGDIFLIECANRGGGCYTSSRIVPAVSGYDLSEYLILSALGERDLKVAEDAESMKKASVLSFIQLSAGKIVSIENQEQIMKRNHILAFRLSVKPGDTITTITNDANRHGFLITTGATTELAKQHAEAAKQDLVIRYER